MSVNRPTVLILSNDPAFAREVTACWPSDPPEFEVLQQDPCPELRHDVYDLAICDAGSNPVSILETLFSVGKPAILVHSDSLRPRCGMHEPVLLLYRHGDAWPAVVGVLGHEILRRAEAEYRARHAEQGRAVVETEATLGRYMVEMRHTVSNALTSVLGNAELLLHEPGLPANVLAQADTVRNMALRLHEVFHRFASIEQELRVAAREAGKGASVRAAMTD